MRKYFWPIVVIVGALLLLFGSAFVGLWTDWLWFKDLGFATIFSTILWTRVKIGILFGVLFFAIIYSNLWYARRIAPPPSPAGIEQQLIERLGSLARRGIGILIFAGSVVISAMVGFEAATHWYEWLMYMHSVPFGTNDPVFARDIGFYVFKLPLLTYLYHWMFFAVAAAAVASAGLHYADEAIEYFGNRLQFAPKVKPHLAILVAIMFFLKAWGYRLSAYGLMSGQGNLFDGPGFTDAHVRIPIFTVLAVISIIAGILVLVNITRRGIGPAIAGLVLLVGASLILGAAYPAIVQNYSVMPNQLVKETPYIRRAIKATRDAYGLSGVAARQFAAEGTLTPQQVEANSTTIENIRLWDKEHLLQAYSQIQTLQQYYEFADVDIDRYWLKEKGSSEESYRQVWLAARELSLPEDSRTWINLHLQYTHGYGIVMSPVNAVSAEGMPQFFVKDIPPITDVDLMLKRMQIYFGEQTNEYAFVKTSADEFDYPNRESKKPYRYEAKGGIGAGGFFRKLLLALRFSDVNIMFNDQIKSDSRILFRREVGERIQTLMPFLYFDKDPYLVTVNGDLYWMRDGYTISDAYPYSRHFGNEGVSLNYMRNSVKVVVDAYSGEVHAYIIQKPVKDPIIVAYSRAFPGIFQPISEMPKALYAHIRYPEGLFAVQTSVYRKYHMSDPREFYNSSDLWDIPMRPVLAKAGESRTEELMEPYYVIMKLPNGTQEEFILMTPYKRAGKQNMVAWMCAKCDPADYGRLVLFKFPQDKNVYGPEQIAGRIDQDSVISPQISLWNQEGSNVGTGNLLVVPIDNSLLYVMPIYLVSSGTKIPELKRVIVALGYNIAMEPTLEEALAKVVGASINVPQLGMGRKPAGAPTAAAPLTGSPGAELQRLINQATSQMDAAEQAQRAGNWAAYGEQLKALRATLKQLREKSK